MSDLQRLKDVSKGHYVPDESLFILTDWAATRIAELEQQLAEAREVAAAYVALQAKLTELGIDLIKPKEG